MRFQPVFCSFKKTKTKQTSMLDMANNTSRTSKIFFFQPRLVFYSEEVTWTSYLLSLNSEPVILMLSL